MGISVVRPELAGKTAELRLQFDAARPFRHLVMDDFVDPAFCDELLAAFPQFSADRARNELGEIGRKAVFADLARIAPAYARLDELLKSREFLDWLSAATGIPALLYDAQYIGGGTHENLDGQDLDTHVDFNYHPAHRLHRRLNLILFLNPEWQEDWGGALELQADPWLPPEQNEISSIVPLANRCVVFETTEHSWHGFRRIQLPEDKRHLSRRSIAVYFYTKERPREETAPSHGTVYVPRPLPERMQPGYTLSDEDLAEIRLLMARRDQQIRYLYDREQQYARMIEGPTYRLATLLTSPFRKLLGKG